MHNDNTKNTRAQNVIRECVLQVRVTREQLNRLNEFCQRRSFDRPKFVLSTIFQAINRIDAYRDTPITIDPTDAAVMENTKGKI